MKITSVCVKPVAEAPAVGMVARISMTVDSAIAMRGIRLMRQEDGTFRLNMAAQRRRSDPEKVDELFFPLNADCRKRLTDVAVSAYQEAAAKKDGQTSYIYDVEECPLEEGLNITEIRMFYPRNPESRCKAFVSITLDDEFVLRNMFLTQRDDGTLHLSMPSFENTRDREEGPINIFHPVSQAARIRLTEAVVEKYEAEVKSGAVDAAKAEAA